MKLVGEQETTEEISEKSYLGTLLIGTIPVYGDVMLIKWSKDSNVRVNKQHLCSAYYRLKFMLMYPSLVAVAIIAFIFGRCI